MLKGKTLFVTGASRGIGKEIALRAAKEGANIVLAAKTSTPHPTLPGTIYTAAEEIQAAGGKALPIVCDIRSEEQIQSAVKRAVEEFGGIDIVINNASAIFLKGTAETPMKRYDLMNQINARGTYATTQACLPYLKESAKKGRNPHVLMISPPLDLDKKWFQNHVAYTIAKYGMSMCVLGMAAEFEELGIAVNALWPRTAIATAAVEFMGGAAAFSACRKPEIMADAAYAILCKPAAKCSGNFFIDDDVLLQEGIKDLDKYATVPGTKTFLTDLFVNSKL